MPDLLGAPPAEAEVDRWEVEVPTVPQAAADYEGRKGLGGYGGRRAALSPRQSGIAPR